ncbi:YIF1-domain-containing protein [Piromyces finnis]|uniref:Protein YIF1 n=1 Tax=Piromyces finnis TaxID=1754191 RepID=A0A1Y1V3X4_9FUNG|nr:YIF1-domain-containing protein [Piromyces finnis]|eukprot:ORX46672.1 YIF1-domain-containing protein [Piromyces finnis]
MNNQFNQQWQQPQTFIHSPQPHRMQTNSYDPYQQQQQSGMNQSFQQQQPQQQSQQQTMNNGYFQVPNPQNMQFQQNNNNNNFMGGNQGFNQQQQQNQEHKPFQNFLGNNFLNDPTTQLGFQLGQKAFESGAEMVNQNINRWFNSTALKKYFDVTNSFVFKKIGLVLFPFRHKSWARIGRRNEQTGKMEYNSPREDINSPDLYIPLMSCVTYVILYAISTLLSNEQSKEKKQFDPELLGITTLKLFSLLVGEVLFMKLICYLMSISADVAFFDLISYSGYKFIGIIVVLIVKNGLKSKFLTYLVYTYVSLALGFFMLRSMKYFVLTDQTLSANSQRRNKIHFLFFIAIMEIVISWFLIV